MEKNNYKSKMFEEAIKMVLWDYHKKEIDEFNNIKENEKHRFSSEFETKMSKLLKRGRRFKGEFKISALKVFQKTAIIVLVILSISFVSLFSVEAIRKEIFSIITTFYEKFIEVRFVSTSSEVPIPETIEEIYLPSYIPDGYWEDSISESDNNIRAIYRNNENRKVSYYQNLLSDFVAVDGENFVEEDILVSGMSGKVYEYNKPDDIYYCIVIWNDNKYSYQLISFLNKEESIKVAESVKLKSIEK